MGKPRSTPRTVSPRVQPAFNGRNAADQIRPISPIRPIRPISPARAPSRRSLRQSESLRQTIRRRVERSKAAFLLIGNPGDGVWPSDALSEITIERLKAHNHPLHYELLAYADGGHMLIPYPYYPTTMRQFYLPTIRVWEGLGGTARGAAKAVEDSWPKVATFLRRELRAEE